MRVEGSACWVQGLETSSAAAVTILDAVIPASTYSRLSGGRYGRQTSSVLRNPTLLPTLQFSELLHASHKEFIVSKTAPGRVRVANDSPFLSLALALSISLSLSLLHTHTLLLSLSLSLSLSISLFLSLSLFSLSLSFSFLPLSLSRSLSLSLFLPLSPSLSLSLSLSF